MAHIGIVSAAYWGDVMPFAPIADELVVRGHQVSFVVPRGFHETLSGHGFDLVHLGTDFSPRELAEHGDIMEHADTIRGARAAMDVWVRQMTLDPIRDILAVLDRAAPELWLTHNTAAWVAQLQAEPSATPVVVGHLFPMMVPSAHQAPPMLPLPGKGLAPLNQFGWWLGRRMVARMMYDDRINRLRADRGLPPRRANVGFGWQAADRILMLSSEAYWPRPPDWPAIIEYTGFTIWGSQDDPLPADLAAYLAEGEPPVLVTMGTSAATNAKDAFSLTADAITALGHRPLLLVGHPRNRQALANRDDTWTFAPIPAVLPSCRAVVHTAGHGTTAATLHAGIPQVVMPQGFDQVAHARRLEELGVGVRVPWKKRSTAALQEALERTQTPEVQQCARQLGQRLRGDNGPTRAADAVESVLAAT